MSLNIEDQHISLNDASIMTAKFRENKPIGTIIANLFSKEIIEEILAQPDCEGIRLYYAIDDINEATLVMTGVDANKNDLCNGILAEHTEKCPLICSVPNPLNC